MSLASASHRTPTSFPKLATFGAVLFLTVLVTGMPSLGGSHMGRQSSSVYRFPDGLFSCERPPDWVVSEYVPAKDGLGPGVTFLQPLGEALISLRYFPRSGEYRGRRLIPPVYSSARDYYRRRVREKMNSSLSVRDAGPAQNSRLLPGSWKGKRAFEFSLAYTEEFNGGELNTGPEQMRADVVLLPTNQGLFAIDYSSEVNDFRADRGEFQAILKTLRLKDPDEPAAVGAATVPQFPPLTLFGVPVSPAEETGKPAAEVKQDLGAIAGRVTDQEKSPVPLVRVSAEGGPRGGKFTTQTRANGDYRLVGLEPGLYQVTFIHVAFQVVVFRNVGVPPGKTVTLNVRLRVAPHASGER